MYFDNKYEDCNSYNRSRQGFCCYPIYKEESKNDCHKKCYDSDRNEKYDDYSNKDYGWGCQNRQQHSCQNGYDRYEKHDECDKKRKSGFCCFFRGFHY